MSSDEECYNEYDMDKDCQDTFRRSREESYFQNIEHFDDEENEAGNKGIDTSINEFNVPKYDKDVNKKVRENTVNDVDNEVDSGESNHLLDDFIELMQNQEDQKEVVKEDSNKETRNNIEINKKKLNDNDDTIDGVLIQKHSGIRIVKSSFSSDSELNMAVNDYGQYFKLTELPYRKDFIDKSKNTLEWFTIAVIGSKSETKCSAKGNNYIIFNLYDLNNLEREQEISLFLFGQSYKTHWKTSEFQCILISKPDFLDDPKTNDKNSKNQFSHKPSKKVENKKLSLSIRNENQLVLLGNSKDITPCQSYKKNQVGSNERNTEASQRCKNLVNLRVSKFCIYHCKKLDNSFKMDKFGAKSKNSPFGKPMNQFEPKKYNSSDGVQVYSPKINLNNIPIKSSKYKMETQNEEKREKFIEKAESNSSILIQKVKTDKQQLKEKTILSLTYNQHESQLLSQVAFKSAKASDKEILAKLVNENIDDKEIKNIRILAAQEQNTATYSYSNESKQVNKEMKNLFNSKALLPNETNCNVSISAKKLVELKNSSFKFEPSKDDKKANNLAAMASHRDIMKKIKKNDTGDVKDDDDDNDEKEKVVEKKLFFQNNKPTLKVFDFLKERVSDISNNAKNFVGSQIAKLTRAPSISDDFELDIYIGDEKTNKKLMDLSPSQSKVLSPKTLNNNDSRKRKIDKIQSPNANIVESDKEKKRKLIDDLINIKSKYSKDANDPEKNAHLKSYLSRLEEKESVENHLSSIKRKEVRVVTCKICSYTSFSQSDLCKSKRHDISRHTALQRYFKCKNCSKRTFTLDKVFPVSACAQCGSEKFDQCGMKNEAIETTLITNEIIAD